MGIDREREGEGKREGGREREGEREGRSEGEREKADRGRDLVITLFFYLQL